VSTTDTTAARLDISFDGLPWVIGPTESRPFDAWLPEALAVMEQILQVPQGEPRMREYVEAVLRRVGRDDGEHPLPYRAVRWLSLPEPPFVVSFGLSRRGTEEEHDAFLAAVDSGPVEPPYVDPVEDVPAGTTVRRSVSYSPQGPGLLIEARYLVDTGDPDAIALVQAATRDAGELVKARDDLDELARRMRVVR